MTLANFDYIRNIGSDRSAAAQAPPPQPADAPAKGSSLSTPPTQPPTTHDADRQTGGLPLNAFQRILRGWEAVHPYNAVQVMELRRPVDPAAASAAWGQTLEELDVGRVEVVNWIQYRHVCLNGEMAKYPVRQLPTGTSLDAYLSGELNRPFDDPGEPPFRPFVLPDPAAGTWQFGIVYQHWVADSVAVRLLLKRWLLRVFAPDRLRPERVRHADAGYIHLSGLTSGEETPGQTLLSMVRRHLKYRKARKPVTLGDRDYPVAVTLARAPGLVPALIDSAHRRGAKVNDLFLAAAARACDERIPTQRRHRRPDLAVGSIVDLRPLARGALDDRFGLFLGFSEVICSPDELAAPADLVDGIARQNRLTRRRGIWPSSMGYLLAALAARPLVPPRKLYAFLRKETPIIAGVSNVNLNRTWVADEHPGLVARYRRISPTGPLAPVVFSLTSLGDDLELSLTYRTALLSEARAGELRDAFLSELGALARAG